MMLMDHQSFWKAAGHVSVNDRSLIPLDPLPVVPLFGIPHRFAVM